MVKITDYKQHLEAEEKAQIIMEAQLRRVPALQFELKNKNKVSESGQYDPDLIYTVQQHNGSGWTLICEVKTIAEPRHVRMAVYKLRDDLKRLTTPNNYPILIAPFISKESARICEEAGIGYVDLAGNARLAFGAVFISVHGHTNPIRDKRERSLFAPKASRVLRVMLDDPHRPWKVTELAAKAHVSLGQVSNVRKALMDREWAFGRHGQLQLVQPKELLSELRAQYRPLIASTRKAYTLMQGDDLDNALRLAMQEATVAKGHLVTASFSAAKWIAPFVRMNTLFVYADTIGEKILEEKLKLEPAGKGENVIVMCPKDEGVFHGAIRDGKDLLCTSPIQTYLDLSAASERGQEAADYLFTTYIEKNWLGNK